MQVTPQIALTEHFLAQRYAGAWQEINARLQSRQTVNVTFTVAISAGVLTLIAALGRSQVQDWWESFCVWPPLLSWSFALWNRHNDAVIGLLSAYCKAYEEFGDKDNTAGVPAWHMDKQNWIVKAREYRKNSDRGLAVAFAIGAVPSFLLLVQHCITWTHLPFLALHIPVIGVVFLSVWYVWQNSTIRQTLSGASSLR